MSTTVWQTELFCGETVKTFSRNLSFSANTPQAHQSINLPRLKLSEVDRQTALLAHYLLHFTRWPGARCLCFRSKIRRNPNVPHRSDVTSVPLEESSCRALQLVFLRRNFGTNVTTHRRQPARHRPSKLKVFTSLRTTRTPHSQLSSSIRVRVVDGNVQKLSGGGLIN